MAKDRTPDPLKIKRQFLKRDCRNDYGENNKAARKVIPRFKTQSNRAFRRKGLVLLQISSRPDAADVDELADRTAGAKFRPKNRKVPDRPLGEMLTYKLKMRKERVGRKVRIAALQERFMQELADRANEIAASMEGLEDKKS